MYRSRFFIFLRPTWRSASLRRGWLRGLVVRLLFLTRLSHYCLPSVDTGPNPKQGPRDIAPVGAYADDRRVLCREYHQQRQTHYNRYPEEGEKERKQRGEVFHESCSTTLRSATLSWLRGLVGLHFKMIDAISYEIDDLAILSDLQCDSHDTSLAIHIDRPREKREQTSTR